jgi:hypothetical protein
VGLEVAEVISLPVFSRPRVPGLRNHAALGNTGRGEKQERPPHPNEKVVESPSPDFEWILLELLNLSDHQYSYGAGTSQRTSVDSKSVSRH